VGRDPDRGSLERLLDERGPDLMRAAVALTGSRADGEDLLQAAVERLLRNWRRVDTDPEGYLRRTLYNLAADGWRRRGRWHGPAHPRILARRSACR
jgi:DNA-directed RNA polymerase specialized sigma24 family protein